MRIKDVLEFNRDAFFDGAVQIDWYYDDSRRNDVAKSYVFHSKEYHGVENKNLIDTASYTKKIVEKLYEDKVSNRFLLTIAGYGTGKSHLGVILATLLGENNYERELVLNKIKDIDSGVYEYIKKNLNGRNLILALNGMNDFNLNYQVLKVAQIALKNQGIDDSFLKGMTNAYEVAEHFVSNQFEKFEERFREYAKKINKYNLSINLKKELEKNLRNDSKAYDIVNEVYKEVTSNYIKWDEGISAGEIINKLNKKLCVETNTFDNIVILFDEFGRFIEYAGTAGTTAGESGLQQIFEAIQNANSNVMFIGLIQSDLNAYLSRTDNSSNIIRYVGRYESSEKLYISSNLETILASLIIKKDENKFEKIVSSKIDTEHSKYYSTLYSSIKRWLPDSNIVWKNESLYNRIVVKGTYPLHPITVWLLCNSSDWMQQRSTLTFAEEVFERYGEKNVFKDTSTLVYATELINSKFFDELLNSEEKGMKNSQNCMMYKNIISLYGEKLSEIQSNVLQGILISNIGKFKFFDKADNISGLKYITGVYKDLDKVLDTLENDLGMISYDENIKRYEFIASGNGVNDYKKVYFKYRAVTRINFVSITDEEVRKDIVLDDCFETKFSVKNEIKTKEWRYEKRFIDIKELNEEYVSGLVAYIRKATDGQKARGIYLWVYCDSENYNTEKIERLVKQTCALKSGIIVSVLNDAKDELKEEITKITILNKFSEEEKNKYNKIYKKKLNDARKKAVRVFTMLASKRIYITEEGVTTISDRAQVYCGDKFQEIYYKVVPFAFDGFSNKSISKAQKYYKSLIELLINERYKNRHMMASVLQDVKNRLDATLREDFVSSWGIFNKEYKLIIPKNEVVYEISKEILCEIEKFDGIKGIKLLNKYLQPPYGLNLYQLNLLIVYLMIDNKNLKLTIDGKRVKKSEFVNQLSNKLNLEFIFKCDFLISEIDIKERLEKLFREINLNKYPENSERLKNKLKIILEEEDMPEELEEECYTAQKKIEIGIDIYRTINNDLQELENDIQKIRSKFYIIKSFKLLERIREYRNKEIENGYELSDYLKNELLNKEKSLREIIKIETPKFINRLTFGIKNISECKSKYGIYCVKYLKGINEEELGYKLECKVNSIIENIEKEESFKGISNKLRDIRLEINKTMKFSQIEENIEQLQSIKKLIEGEDMSSSIRNKFDSEISVINEELLNKKDKELKLVDEINSLTNKIISEEDIKFLITKIDYVLELEVNVEDIEKFKILKRDLELYIKSISDFKNKVIDFESWEIYSKQLREKFRQDVLVKLVESNVEEIKNKLEKRDRNWRRDNVDIEINLMTLDQCIQWKNRIEKIPEFISKETKKLLETKKNEVDLKIIDCRVDGAIAIYNRLTTEEKNLFLEKIND